MATDADSRRCAGTTKRGTPCKAAPLTDGDYCRAHDPALPSDAQFGSPDQADADRAKGGRATRRPRPIERMHEWLEEHIETVLRPYVDAIEGAVVMDKVEGMHVVTDIADLEGRMRAAERLLDRVYGRPRQAVEHSGESGGPVRVEHHAELVRDPEAARLAHEFLARLNVRPEA